MGGRGMKTIADAERTLAGRNNHPPTHGASAK